MEQPRDETALGYELDTISLRDIAAVRYARHHEWLDHILGSVVPTSRIEVPSIRTVSDMASLDKQLESAKAELEELRKQKSADWNIHDNSEKTSVLVSEIARLRNDFGQGVAEESQRRVEEALGKKLVPLEPMQRVEVTYNRQREEKEAAAIAAAKRQKEEEAAEAEAKARAEAEARAQAETAASEEAGKPQFKEPFSGPQSNHQAQAQSDYSNELNGSAASEQNASPQGPESSVQSLVNFPDDDIEML